MCRRGGWNGTMKQRPNGNVAKNRQAAKTTYMNSWRLLAIRRNSYAHTHLPTHRTAYLNINAAHTLALRATRTRTRTRARATHLPASVPRSYCLHSLTFPLILGLCRVFHIGYISRCASGRPSLSDLIALCTFRSYMCIHNTTPAAMRSTASCHYNFILCIPEPCQQYVQPVIHSPFYYCS